MNKIISIVVSIIMLVMSSILPGFTWPGTETVETGAFLAQVDEAFGFQAVDTDGEAVLGVESDNEYYAAVATAAEYDVLVDYETIDVFASVKPEFVATVLATAADLDLDEIAVVIENATSVANVAKVAAAVDAGIISLDARNMLSFAAMDAKDVTAAIEKAVALSGSVDEASENLVLAEGVKTLSDYTVDGDNIVVSADSDLQVGDVYVVEQSDANITGAAYQVEAIDVVDGEKVITNSEVAIEDVVESIDYEGSTDVNFATAMIVDGNGDVISDGYLDASGLSKDDIMKLLKKYAKVSFTVEGFKVTAKVTENGLNFSISKSENGVSFNKSYDLTNLSIDAKADVDIKKLSFNEVYMNLDYDLVDKTTISGSYAKTFGDEVASVGDKLSGDSFWAKLLNEYVLSELDSTSIKLFTITLPLGSTPLTVTLDVLLNIGVNGRMEITVVSEEMHGVEIINNKIRTVNESNVVDRDAKIYGQFELRLGLGAALGLYGYALVDLGIEGGVGAYVDATVGFYDADGNEVYTHSAGVIPVDYLKEVVAGADTEGKIDISGHADIYGILNISVGTKSAIGKVGLKKTWTIFDRSNGTFASFEF